MASESDNAADELITVAGGVELEVKFQSDNGTERFEMVKVRQIPISKIPTFLLAMGDEAATIELYCDKPKGWADTLSVESANEIADKGQELNLPFLNAWWRRQAKWRKMQSAWTGENDLGKVPTQSPSDSSPRQSPITTT